MVKIEMIPEDSTLVDLVNSLEFMARKELPNTFKAFKKSAALIAYTWKTYAMGAPIKGSSMRIKNATGGYARSIKRSCKPVGCSAFLGGLFDLCKYEMFVFFFY